MNRKQFEQFVAQTYGADPEYLWEKYPDFAVFRHSNNRKWFALTAVVPGKKLGCPERDAVPIVNVKCSPVVMGSLRGQKGFYPAYHMSKDSWISVALDGTVSSEVLTFLLNMSYDLTNVKGKKRRESDKNV